MILCHCPINFYEINIYFLIWIYGVLFAIYNFYIECNNNFRIVSYHFGSFIKSPNLHQLWMRRHDDTDYEWEQTKNIIYSALPWIFIHIFGSEIFRKINVKIVPVWQAAVGSSFLVILTNFHGLFLLFSQLIVFQISLILFRNFFLIWITSFLCLMLISYFKTIDETWAYQLFNIDEFQHYALILVLCWTNLRCTSFCIDTILKCEKLMENNFLKLICYCFYLPNMFCGPFLHYTEIAHSHKKSGTNSLNLKNRLFILTFDLSRVLVWYIFAEMSLHILYPSVFSFYPEIVDKFNNWALCGYGYWMGQFFHIKYIVFYGFSTSIAKFENIPVPSLPKCIGRIHLYSDMWKNFDKGLHSFLVKYIYIPTLQGKKSTILLKVMASLLCFAFVYIWHGVQWFIFIWATLNFIGITLETVFKTIFKHFNHITSMISGTSRRFVICILASPLLAMSSISNFYFFAGTDIGNIFVLRILYDPLPTKLLLLFMLYCCCQVSIEIKMWEKIKD